MKVLMGCLVSAGLLLAGGVAQAQALPPMRSNLEPVVRVSDVGGPYAAMPPAEYAEPRPYGVLRRGYDLAVLPLREVYSILREAGFSALGMPQQRGLVYTISAIDLDGEDGRLVIDARTGRIMRFIPAYRMGDRMSEEIDARYGPQQGAVPTLPQYRRPPFTAGTATSAPKVASRTTSVPLPKRPPARAVATPAKPVTPAETKPVAVTPPETPPAAAPVQQSAVTEQKPAETKAPETTGAAPATPAAPEKDTAAPTVAPSTTEAKPATPPAAETPPPAQGLE